MSKPKLIRITTVPSSLKILLKGQHRYMSEHFEVVGVSSSGSELEDVSQEEGIRTVAVEMTRTISPIKDLRSVYQLYRLFRKERPDIVHTHTPKAGIVGMLAAKLAGVKLRIHTVAGMPLMEIKGIKRQVLNVVEKLTYRSATHVYPNSKGLYDFILKHKFTQPAKLTIIANGSSNGIDTHHFNQEHISGAQKLALKNELKISEEDFVFIFVGRLVTDKGINELISAFKDISAENKNVKLLMLGDAEPELDPLLPETTSEIETNPNIIAVGFQQDVRPYFAISDVLVFPSYREGFPNVVMQAGAMQLPSIVTNINGCNEIVKQGQNGWIIPPKDELELKTAMNDCLFSSELKKSSDLCRSMIVDRYNQKLIWEGLLTEYQRLLKSVS
ncbi:MAG: glycosyltransferase family 4 protein [Flavobacteriaceae bacterium]|nr:glycosyltransferase family 4 protein [Flavobacteriaceae bacterium]